MIMIGQKAKLIAVGVGIVAIGYGGWMTRGWFEDSKDLSAVEAQQALVAGIREDIAGVSRHVEDRLSELRANETVIDRGVIREIHKPIYQRVCIEPDLVSLLNAALRGDAPTGTAESTGAMPEGSRPTGGRQGPVSGAGD